MPAPPLCIPTIGGKARARVLAVVEACKPALPRAGKRMPSFNKSVLCFLPCRTCMGGLFYNVLYRTALTQFVFPFVTTNSVFPHVLLRFSSCSLYLLQRRDERSGGARGGRFKSRVDGDGTHLSTHGSHHVGRDHIKPASRPTVSQLQG